MPNASPGGPNQEEMRIINDSLETPADNWGAIASQIQDDFRQGKIGRFESSPVQEVAKLDRLIAQNIEPGSSDRLFPQFQIDGQGNISFTVQEHKRETKEINHKRP
ncbi:MAG TPA: hypothetical protein V6C89_16085 [Drouetiella sp.]|jgi:hypothetical protein